jgi:hypothetical protein
MEVWDAVIKSIADAVSEGSQFGFESCLRSEPVAGAPCASDTKIGLLLLMCVSALTQGMVVILDNHSSDAIWCCNMEVGRASLWQQPDTAHARRYTCPSLLIECQLL